MAEHHRLACTLVLEHTEQSDALGLLFVMNATESISEATMAMWSTLIFGEKKDTLLGQYLDVFFIFFILRFHHSEAVTY